MKGNKINVPGEIFIALGLFLVALSISVMARLEFGISTSSSLPYALNLIVPGISFGAWNLMFQSSLYVIMVLITKKVKKRHILSFVMCLLFALLLDVTKMMVGAVPDELYIRIVLFGISFLGMNLGIALMLTSKMPLMITDMFSNNLATHYNTSFRRIKTMFDVFFLVVSSIVALVFLGALGGTGIGTLIMALVTGTFVQAFGLFLNDHFNIQPLYKKFSEKEKADANAIGPME